MLGAEIIGIVDNRKPIAFGRDRKKYITLNKGSLADHDVAYLIINFNFNQTVSNGALPQKSIKPHQERRHVILDLLPCLEDSWPVFCRVN